MQDKFWGTFDSWADAEKAWDERAAQAAQRVPLRVPSTMPSVPAIVPDDFRWIRWRALRWVVRKDTGLRLIRRLLHHPLKYCARYVRSILSRKSYVRDRDFFFFGCKGQDDIYALMNRDDVIVVVGFSYCEKPHECPCLRFTADCTCDLANDVCRQCFIGKCRHSLPSCRTIPLIIPTINDIGRNVLEIIDAFPTARILFLITACEMALEMFGDFGNMVGVQGVGVRLSGRICNTMRAFALSEEGVKPGLTLLSPSTERRMFELLRYWSRAIS